jgi:hypothetical protein
MCSLGDLVNVRLRQLDPAQPPGGWEVRASNCVQFGRILYFSSSHKVQKYNIAKLGAFTFVYADF